MNLVNRAPGTGEEIHAQIRRDIIFGRLEPAARLRLDALKAGYGVSVSTLREALNRLASEGFVRAEGQKGFQVAPISAANLREIATLRTLLECHAVEASFASGGIDWEAGVVAAHHKLAQMEARMDAGDTSIKEDWKRYDWEFHRELISACGMSELIAVHTSVFDKYLRYQMLCLTHRGATASREHLVLKQAALARDAALARRVLSDHIAGGVAHCLAVSDLPAT